MATDVLTVPVNLTPSAAEEFKKIITEKNVPEDLGLRVGVEGGGCSGFSYILGFDKKHESDVEFEVEGVRVIMDKAHGLYLAGIEIDFHVGLENRGFVFNNPNAESSCGCGKSFDA